MWFSLVPFLHCDYKQLHEQQLLLKIKWEGVDGLIGSGLVSDSQIVAAAAVLLALAVQVLCVHEALTGVEQLRLAVTPASVWCFSLFRNLTFGCRDCSDQLLQCLGRAKQWWTF